MRSFKPVASFFVLLFCNLLVVMAQTQLAVAVIKVEDPAERAKLRENTALIWWVEAEERFLIKAPVDLLRELQERYEHEWLGDLSESQLAFYQLDLHEEGLPKDSELLVRGGRNAVLKLPHTFDAKMQSNPHLMPFKPNSVLARVYHTDANAPKRAINPVFEFFANQVSSVRWRADVERLAGFNRYSHSPHVLEARDWLVSEFNQLHGMNVSTQSFQVGGTTAFNVIAELPGRQKPDEWYVIGAHYDSISENPMNSAPGAEDNASGTAAVLEMARIFSANPPGATIFFICYSGEEQGLYGSHAHASQLVNSGNSSKFKNALIMDMIAYSSDADLDCLLETNDSEETREMVDRFEQHAANFTNLRMVRSFNPFGSDHIPYIQRDLPALLVIENDYDDYPSYHRTTDVANNQNLINTQAADIIRMGVATMADYTDADLNFFLQYWPTAPDKGQVPDLNGNQQLDVGEIILSLNRIYGTK